MIEWHDMDSRLERIGKDRAWLAEMTPYSANSIRLALAPNSNKRSDRLQSVLSKAIEDEEARKAHKTELPPGVHELWLTAEDLHRADMAARKVEAPSLAAFCRDAIQYRAREILARQAGKQPAASPAQSASPHARVQDAMAG